MPAFSRTDHKTCFPFLRFADIIVEKKNAFSLYVFVFLLSYLITGLFIYKDYGLGWDEPFQRSYNGMINYNYIVKGDQELIHAEKHFIRNKKGEKCNEKYHGPAFEIFLIGVEKLFNLGDLKQIFLARHLCTFLIFFISVFFFYLLAEKLFCSPNIAFLGCICLVLSPRIFAHSFYNSKDIPFLSFYIISLYTLICHVDRPTFLNAFLHGLTTAVLIDIRVAGIAIFCLTLFVALIKVFLSWRTDKVFPVKYITIVLCYIGCAVSFTILFWPVLWDGPLYHFMEAFKEMKHYYHGGTSLYLGKHIDVSAVPRHYVLLWMVMTIPEAYIGFFIIGLGAGLFQLRRYQSLQSIDRNLINGLIVLFSFSGPILAVILFRSVLYDGWRHMFFIYPSMLLISLFGIKSLFGLFDRKPKQAAFKCMRPALMILLLAGFAVTVKFMITYHPFQNLYFSPLIGRPLNGAGNFDLDYWGLSYRKALEYIADHDQRPAITVCAKNFPGFANVIWLSMDDQKRMVWADKRKDADYFITNFRYKRTAVSDMDEVYAVTVDGMKIMGVYKSKTSPPVLNRLQGNRRK